MWWLSVNFNSIFYLKICKAEGVIWSFVTRKPFSQYTLAILALCWIITEKEVSVQDPHSSALSQVPAILEQNNIAWAQFLVNPLTQWNTSSSPGTHIRSYFYHSPKSTKFFILTLRKMWKNLTHYLQQTQLLVILDN